MTLRWLRLGTGRCYLHPRAGPPWPPRVGVGSVPLNVCVVLWVCAGSPCTAQLEYFRQGKADQAERVFQDATSDGTHCAAWDLAHAGVYARQRMFRPALVCGLGCIVMLCAGGGRCVQTCTVVGGMLAAPAVSEWYAWSRWPCFC